MLTVFYDERCPLCSAEIDYYKNLRSAEPVCWQGIQESREDRAKLGISDYQALMSLHVVDSEGRIFKGVDAFVRLWRVLPGWKWLAKLVALPPVLGVFKVAYAYFAQRRFKKYAHCLAVDQDCNQCGQS